MTQRRDRRQGGSRARAEACLVESAIRWQAAEPFDATMTRHPAQHKGMMSEHREHGTHGKERARRRVSEGSSGGSAMKSTRTIDRAP